MYLDTAIIVKLLVREADSGWFNHALAGQRFETSELALAEVYSALLAKERAGHITGPERVRAGEKFLAMVEEDLIRAIEQGHLAGATLDVFRTEPLPSVHPFWKHPAIRVTPHISAQTLPKESIAQIANKIMALERGETVAGVVDLQRGY